MAIKIVKAQEEKRVKNELSAELNELRAQPRVLQVNKIKCVFICFFSSLQISFLYRLMHVGAFLCLSRKCRATLLARVPAAVVLCRKLMGVWRVIAQTVKWIFAFCVTLCFAMGEKKLLVIRTVLTHTSLSAPRPLFTSTKGCCFSISILRGLKVPKRLFATILRIGC